MSQRIVSFDHTTPISSERSGEKVMVKKAISIEKIDAS